MKICKKSNNTEHSPNYSLLNHTIGKVKEVKDIGVLIDSSELTFENHISEKVNKANFIFAVRRRIFKYLGTFFYIHNLRENLHKFDGKIILFIYVCLQPHWGINVHLFNKSAHTEMSRLLY